MKIKIQKIPSKERLFFGAYGLYLFFALLSTSFYFRYFLGTPFKLIKVIVICLLGINELAKTRVNLKSFLGLIVSLGIYAIVVYNTSVINDFVLLVMFIYCGRNIPFERIAKFTILLSSIVLVFVILSSYLGIIENYIEASSSRVREYLGFRYALFPSAILFNITGLTLYVHKEKQRLLSILILVVTNLWLYQKTNSRLSFYLAITMIFVTLLFERFPVILEKSKLIHIGMSLSFLLSAIISFYFTVTYNGAVQWMRDLNTILGGRLQLGQRSLLLYGFSLFGNKNMEWVGNGLDAYGKKSTANYLWVDNFFVSALQRFGLLVSILIILLFTFVLFKCLKDKKYHLMVLLTFTAGHCIVDDLFLYLHYNTFWFAIGTVLIGSGYELKNRINSQSLSPNAKKRKL